MAVLGVDGVLAPHKHRIHIDVLYCGLGTHLCYPADVLVPVLLCEAQVLVQAEAHVVAVETVRSIAKMQKVLLERSRDGGLARSRQAGEPDGEALLLAEAIALSARQRRVPGDVAVPLCQ